MSESIAITGETKEEKYLSLLPQIKALLEGEQDLIANLANLTSAIKYGMDFFWVGFYFVKNGELVLGPFQGTIACTRIKNGRGVCGSCMQKQETIIVEDVDAFPGHIACSSLSKSEIVLPVFNSKNELVAVLDVDDDKYATFDTIDKQHLEALCKIAGALF
ncbi:MAG: GAF domain-containing protein [Bacteroidota bacterium]|nr:GAF domain-containing protein [Bacteroidota bacterium]